MLYLQLPTNTFLIMKPEMALHNCMLVLEAAARKVWVFARVLVIVYVCLHKFVSVCVFRETAISPDLRKLCP